MNKFTVGDYVQTGNSSVYKITGVVFGRALAAIVYADGRTSPQSWILSGPQEWRRLTSFQIFLEEVLGPNKETT